MIKNKMHNNFSLREIGEAFLNYEGMAGDTFTTRPDYLPEDYKKHKRNWKKMKAFLIWRRANPDLLVSPDGTSSELPHGEGETFVIAGIPVFEMPNTSEQLEIDFESRGDTK